MTDLSNNIKSLKELVVEAKNVFRKEFNAEPQIAVCAPGRVNLIGEHTDYNEGFVLPMALPLITVIVGSRIQSDDSIFVTTNTTIPENERRAIIGMPTKQTFDTVHRPGYPKWANYIKGVLANYIGPKPAFLGVMNSSVPVGGGLSSSAAFEVACYLFFDALNSSEALVVGSTDKALACQKAEHDFAGVPCGIMDQFISMMGKQDNALLIDCKTMVSTLVPFIEPNIVILIIDSNVKHELTGSEYSSRRKQCEDAARLLNKTSLREATEEDIEYLKSSNADELIIKRARHVVSEIKRTEAAAKLLKEKNFAKFGQLMTESHNSLQYDFEVSCEELDNLVHLALEIDGVLGSRMTGGGFGGCTVTLVYKNNVEQLIGHIKKNYKGKPTFYVCKPSDGAKILNIDDY